MLIRRAKYSSVLIGLLVIIASLTLLLDSRINVYADDANSSDKTTLEVNPVSERISANPGETISKKITVKNNGNSALSFTVYAATYVNGDGGETQDYDTDTAYTQISKWISFNLVGAQEETRPVFRIEPKTSQEISYNITVPENAPGGGQYACIFVELIPEEMSEDIQITSRAGIVLYASIAGEIKNSAQIKNINADAIAINNNLGMQFTVANEGNIDFQALSNIKVSSLFGRELYSNSSLALVMPGNSRTITSVWSDAPTFGIYRLDYDISALDINASGTQFVFVATPTLLAASIVLLIAVFTAIFFLIKHALSSDAGIDASIDFS